MKLFRFWQFNVVGITMMVFAIAILNPSSFFGTFVGMIGLVLFGFPFYYAFMRSAVPTGRKE